MASTQGVLKQLHQENQLRFDVVPEQRPHGVQQDPVSLLRSSRWIPAGAAMERIDTRTESLNMRLEAMEMLMANLKSSGDFIALPVSNLSESDPLATFGWFFSTVQLQVTFKNQFKVSLR